MEVSASALDYLLIEAVPVARDVIEQLGIEDQEEAHHRIELYGYQVGKGLAQVFTRSRPRMVQQLEIIKFVCKNLWEVLYKKQMDNLKTNHRDTYVLVDHNFEFCRRMGTSLPPQATAELAYPYLCFPAGIIRGFLHAMGLSSTVTVEAPELPMVTFNVRIE